MRVLLGVLRPHHLQGASPALLATQQFNILTTAMSLASVPVLSTQCEPMGTIRLSVEAAERMGLGHLDPTQLKLISAMILAKPVSPCEAACALLGIPMIRTSAAVQYVNTAPPSKRTVKWCSKARHFFVPPVDHYVQRPACCEAQTLDQYFRNHQLVRPGQPAPTKHTLVGVDGWGHSVRVGICVALLRPLSEVSLPCRCTSPSSRGLCGSPTTTQATTLRGTSTTTSSAKLRSAKSICCCRLATSTVPTWLSAVTVASLGLRRCELDASHKHRTVSGSHTTCVWYCQYHVCQVLARPATSMYPPWFAPAMHDIGYTSTPSCLVPSAGA